MKNIALTVVLFLTGIFFLFKLAQVGLVKDWSWWTVFSPLLIYTLLALTWAIVTAREKE